MCGIVAYLGDKRAEPVIVAGLEKLEYRGYDSAGIALCEGKEIEVVRALGKLAALKEALRKRGGESGAGLGIGHTRWATHGRPSEQNAHPHTAGRVSLIHNGIIENYLDIRRSLTAKGCSFSSDTDTEIAAHLLNSFLEEGLEPFEALKAACSDIKGSYAFVAFDAQNPDSLLVAKSASPIIIGLGRGEVFVASDIPALLEHTRDVIILEDGDMALLKCDSIRIENAGTEVKRKWQRIDWDPVSAQKGGYKHFMLKEIHEQPEVVADTIRGRINTETGEISFGEDLISETQIKRLGRIVFVACGTAWHAALVGKFFIEDLTGIPCEVDYASEYRYRPQLLRSDSLLIAVSQSGETADTIGAVDVIRGRCSSMAVCNVIGSSLTRKVDGVLYTRAGPEISVASTKAFTTQLVALYLFARHVMQSRGSGGARGEDALDIFRLPGAVSKALEVEDQVKEAAKKFYKAKGFLFTGRGICYPVALEGALKLKEISYIHAEGYPAGELKHGPIALIDENLPVVVVLQRSNVLFEKALSNLREVESREGQIIVVTDVEDGLSDLHDLAVSVIKVPYVSQHLSPVLLSIPLQLLAYYIAVNNGTDVDQPRNLAKSVTVE